MASAVEANKGSSGGDECDQARPHHRAPTDCARQAAYRRPGRAAQCSVAWSCQPSWGGVTVYLQSGDAQAGNPVSFDCSLPGLEFLHR
jgi:hypothetical protein